MNTLHSDFIHIISSSITLDKKTSEIIAWVFPIVMIAIFLRGTPSDSMLSGGAVTLFAILVVVGVQYEVVLRLADEVTATDTHFLVKSGTDTTSVPYDAIRAVSYSKPRGMPDRITIHLTDTELFGGRLSFKPEEQFRTVWGEHPITNNLLTLLKQNGV